MALDPTVSRSFGANPRANSTAAIVDQLSHFDGPPEAFLVNLLAVQCTLASAEAGTFLRIAGKKVELLAVYPPMEEGATAPVWLAQAVEATPKVVQEGVTSIRPIQAPDEMYGTPAKRNLIMVPLLTGGTVRGVGVFLIQTDNMAVLAHSQERLELSSSLLSLYEMRLTLQRRQSDLRRLRLAMETLAAVNEHNRFSGAGMALVNEAAARWQCDRVGLGFLKGRYVHLKALSHTEKINRKMKLVQDIESCMEECLDQDVELVYPAPEDATYVCRATQELAKRHGPMTVLAMPLRRGGEVVGVVTAERTPEKPFLLEEAEALRLTCDLATARLYNLHETDKWFGARWKDQTRKAATYLVGPKHTWVKLLAILITLTLLFSFLIKGDFKADASFVVQSQETQIVPAPFDGYIEEVFVEPGDVVTPDTVLAKLETIQLESELISSRADYAKAMTEAATAMRDGKISEAQIAQADAEKAQAAIQLLERRIQEAYLKSPVGGTVVSPDLKRRIRGHVAIGDAMFEVSPIDQLRAELSVPEEEIAYVFADYDRSAREHKELRGELATEGAPGRRIGFSVERINPVAEVEDARNVFKVRVRLDEIPAGMRPGMKGVAKIEIGKRPYIYLWTRKLINWVRMKLWI